MKKSRMLALTAIILIMTCGGCERGAKTSAAREWAFDMEKVWEIQQAGEDQLSRPAEPRIADDGTLYFHDFDSHLSYIVDSNGKLINTFASRGTGEGEVQFYINCFPAGDYVAVCAPDKIHFFTKQGQFVKAVENNLFVRFPLAFKDENDYWVAPGALGDTPSDSAAVTHINLTSDEETAIYKFALSDEERKPSGGAVVIGLTPQIKMGYDPQSDRIYFGKNSDSIIYRLAGENGEISSFSFTGTRHPVSESDKRAHFTRFNIPEEQVASLIKALPDRMAYYNRIQVIDGLIYLLSSAGFGEPQTEQIVNVFSPDGRHLYFGRIQVEEGWHISNPDNLQLAQGFVYAVQENDAGDRKVVKYRVKLPTS